MIIIVIASLIMSKTVFCYFYVLCIIQSPCVTLAAKAYHVWEDGKRTQIYCHFKSLTAKDNKHPSNIKFSKHLDRKLHSHLEWPYRSTFSSTMIPVLLWESGHKRYLKFTSSLKDSITSHMLERFTA